jgi:Phage integrase SAM-like domain/Phage integrase family
MKVRFNLKEPYKNGSCAINLVLEYNRQKLKYATGLTVLPVYWNPLSHRVHLPKGVKRSFAVTEFNQQLQTIETETERIFYRLKNEKERNPTLTELRAHLDRITNRNQEKPVTLLEFLKIRTDELKKERKSESVAKKYITVLNFLKEYAPIQNRKSFDFEDITEPFLTKIKHYFFEVKKHNPNTVHKNIDILKIAMREAKKRKYHSFTDYENFTIKKVPTHQIYLNEGELGKIYNLDLSDKEGHEVTRDLFIIGCFTSGLRFSDWAKIRPEQIEERDGKLICTVVTEKTGQSVSFPLTHSYVKEILQKYNNQLPKPISNQKSNDYLKEIGKWAGIDNVILRIEYEGVQRIETSVPKYEMIVTHTARRSLATNLANRNYPLNQIRLLTGHSTEKQLIQYLKTSSFENAVNVSSSEFFNG